MPDPQTQERKRVAIVATIWTYLSHAQHMGDRFLIGYPWEGRWQCGDELAREWYEVRPNRS